MLGDAGNVIGSLACYFLHCAVIVAHIAQGGANVNNALLGSHLTRCTGQISFAGIMGISLCLLKPTTIQ